MADVNNNPAQAAFDKMLKRSKTIGIIVGIVLFILGILIVSMPVIMGAALLWLAAVGILIGGATQIVRYFETPADYRNGGVLVNGIITALVGVFMLFPTFGEGGVLANTAARGSMFAFMFALISVSAGMNQCVAYGVLKKGGAKGAGWTLFAGIMNLICGLFFIISPLTMEVAFEWIAGYYLIFYGIILFAAACTGSKA